MSALITKINFSSLSSWSVKYLKGFAFTYNPDFNLVKISSFLKRNKTQVEVLDNIEYKRVTIKMNNGGVYLRDKKKGIDIGTKKQYLISSGQFLLSKIDARNGAFGVVTEELDNAIITGNFWTFDVDTEVIDPVFLSLITTTNQFLLFCQMASNGTTGRHYLQEEEFLDMSIPLPNKDTQKLILQKYFDNKNKSDFQINQNINKQKEIKDYLAIQLGLEKNNIEKTGSLLFKTSFKNLNLWSVDNILRTKTFDSNLYALTTLSEQNEAVIDVFRGKSPKYKDNTNSVILNQKCVRFNSIELEHAKTVDNEWLGKIDNNFLTKENDILINSTGDGTIGRATIVKKEEEGFLYDSHVLLLRLNPEIIDPLFFVYFNNSEIGQEQIENIKSAK